MKSKKKFLTFSILLLLTHHVFAQGVGINIDTPKAMLHVAGTVRIDSFKTSNGIITPLAVDSFGNIVKIIPSLQEKTISLVYGESIAAGDLVAVGDGLTGYKSVDQQATPFTSLSVPMGEWVAQSFTTSSKAIGIKAVQFRAGSSQTTFTAKIRRCVNGLPSGPDLGTASYFHQANNTALQFMLIFDPPVPVSPNTSYAFIIDFQKAGGGANSFFYSNTNAYPNGTRLYSSNIGASWTSFANQDMVFSVYETQTQSAQIYKAMTVSSTAAVLDGATNHGYSTTDEDHFGVGDRLNNIIGVATQSGSASENKSVYVGNPCTGFNGLAPGSAYYIGSTPGQVSKFAPSGFIVQKVGFAATTQKMILEK